MQQNCWYFGNTFFNIVKTSMEENENLIYDASDEKKSGINGNKTLPKKASKYIKG